MTITPINIGTAGNDGTGDTLRAAFGKVNTNLTNLDSSVTSLNNSVATNATNITTAQTTATNAGTAAAAAQTTATNAASAASTAQTTATNAGSAASAAQTTANSASSAAGAAQTTANTAVTNAAATGITFTGSLSTGMQLLRTGGSASGTITESIESPWSNNQVGQRQVIGFSLGSGTNAEQWKLLYANGSLATFGIDSSLLGTEYFLLELDIEITAALNLQYIGAIFQETNSRLSAQAGVGVGGTGFTMLADTGEVTSRPLGGRHLLTTQPMILPVGSSSVNCGLLMGFDASGAAGTATATLKINNCCLRRAYV